MKVTLESTPEIIVVGDVETRAWTGTTAGGVPVVALVARLGVAEGADAGELERELAETPVVVVDRLAPPRESRPTRLAWLEPAVVRLHHAARSTLALESLEHTRRVRAYLVSVLEELAPAVETIERELAARRARLDALAAALGASDGDRRRHVFGRAISADLAIGEAEHQCAPRSPEGPLPAAVVERLVADPIVAGADAATAGDWLAWALRGAAMGWHARHAHPADVANVGRAASAHLDEPARAAWLAGYDLGARHGAA